MEKTKFVYEIRLLKSGEILKHEVEIHWENLGEKSPLESKYLHTQYLPPWTALDFHKCENCPLNTKEHPRCPVALGLFELVEKFKSNKSFERVQVKVESPERNYFKETDMQTVLSSLFGLIMASCGCPHLSFFKPLTRFHLPFADMDENLFRLLSLHLNKGLMKQMNAKGGPEVKTYEELLGTLKTELKEVETVNKFLLKRISEVVKADAQKNAFVNLSVFVSNFSYEFKYNFDSLRLIFTLSDPIVEVADPEPHPTLEVKDPEEETG